jgi:hypothetical protein
MSEVVRYVDKNVIQARETDDAHCVHQDKSQNARLHADAMITIPKTCYCCACTSPLHKLREGSIEKRTTRNEQKQAT